MKCALNNTKSGKMAEGLTQIGRMVLLIVPKDITVAMHWPKSSNL